MKGSIALQQSRGDADEKINPISFIITVMFRVCFAGCDTARIL